MYLIQIPKVDRYWSSRLSSTRHLRSSFTSKIDSCEFIHPAFYQREGDRRKRKREDEGGLKCEACMTYQVMTRLSIYSLSLIRHISIDSIMSLVHLSFSPFSNRVTLFHFPFLFVQRKESRKTGEGTV